MSHRIFRDEVAKVVHNLYTESYINFLLKTPMINIIDFLDTSKPFAYSFFFILNFLFPRPLTSVTPL